MLGMFGNMTLRIGGKAPMGVLPPCYAIAIPHTRHGVGVLPTYEARRSFLGKSYNVVLFYDIIYFTKKISAYQEIDKLLVINNNFKEFHPLVFKI